MEEAREDHQVQFNFHFEGPVLRKVGAGGHLRTLRLSFIQSLTLIPDSYGAAIKDPKIHRLRWVGRDSQRPSWTATLQ